MRLVHLYRRFATTCPNHVFRNATAKEIDLFTQRTIREGWHVGPYDYPCGFAFDPKGFFVREIDQEMASHMCAIRYPGSHSHLGGLIVTEFRAKGWYRQDSRDALKFCDQSYTIGCDTTPALISVVEREPEGYKKVWDTCAASFNIQRIADKLAAMTFPKDVLVKPLYNVQLEKLLEYDRSVFGTDRRVFMERWISAPGSFGYVAVDGNDEIVGYAILKQAIRGAGTEIGLAIAPLYSDNPHIAKCLLKTAAERCLANQALKCKTLGGVVVNTNI